MKKELQATLYTSTGKEAGKIQLPAVVFDVPWNDALMHQVVTSMLSNARTPIAHTKFRGEVRGGGKKPWQQKGTGRARHGSTRSPIWRGGGVTHGPRNEKVYARVIPKKMRAKALFMALSRKLRDNELLLVDSFGFTAPSTANAKKTLLAFSNLSGFERIAGKKRNAALIALTNDASASHKSFRNIGSVKCIATRDLNPVAVLGSTYIVIENPQVSLALLENRARSKPASSSSDSSMIKTRS
ncbi:MAG: 50S ribosomal protein L4 [Candidatus Kaiserbacteria bacterium GW2011_GWC2_49_12]|nr:MAG: 50S ribosomal protein L4 [Candidatus Kaiserbacteria bacterium GW2011_GWC2_49_12]KKW08286.1 MAG: 50S ribosomal protein L4 [Candidatus Kaiserbacteria bacterium GW2011_GWA2_49_56]KKW16207.1 MAG: 50S ribosomal protein L4 [Candidatus Kaiserbacteria bacterium GW2011_GWB1_50_17]KKW17305.1 MAG: 50S ribosomal protein L4 [Candidatus Kaiserbacteria bacterium GW2011_GWA1_50_28]HCM43372.1 50S ribosomal protein L4 [Candidatus Kaiserbacteria bacterium]